jgi:hypothetical protein
MLLTSCQTAALTHGDDGLALSRPCKGASARNLAPCERLPSILGRHEYVRGRTKPAQRRASSQRLSGSSVPSPVTDVSIGAYTVATAMFILGALGHRANTDGTRRSASPLRGLIFAAPACGARGMELLKAEGDRGAGKRLCAPGAAARAGSPPSSAGTTASQAAAPSRRGRCPETERQAVLRELHAERFVDSSPAQGPRRCLTRVATWPRWWAGRLLVSASTAVRSSLRPSDGGAARAAETREASRCRLRAG